MRAGIPIGNPTQLRRCGRCTFEYFSYRYSDGELSALYNDYRDDTYLQQRRTWEPWYSRTVNSSYTEDKTVIEERRNFATRILAKAGIPPSINCAVDVGGDEGQFFPPIEINRRIVCDTSSRPVPKGTERIQNLMELDAVTPDLILMSHILEHLVDPRSMLDAARKAMKPGGLLYVEVPLDRWAVRPRHRREPYRRFLDAVGRYRRLFIVLDALTGVYRQVRRPVPWCGVIKQSEHINYFDKTSLAALLRSSGFEPVADASDPTAKMGGLRIGHYGIAARPIAICR